MEDQRQYRGLALVEDDWDRFLNSRVYFDKNEVLRPQYKNNKKVVAMIKKIKAAHREVFLGDSEDILI